LNVYIKQEMIEQLTNLAEHYEGEAKMCERVEAYTAACVLTASSLESMLLCTVGMSQHVLESAGLWPGDEERFLWWDLRRLAGIATRAGWFEGLGYGEVAQLAGVIDAVTDLRNWYIHPGAFVREGAFLPSESMARTFLRILQDAGTALGDVMKDLPQPPA
jgi:hypothetical protein